jgi:GNAT superfamily N-acetyltransferase
MSSANSARPERLNAGFSIRPANLGDVLVIVHHRRAMFEEMGVSDVQALDDMEIKFKEWVTEKLKCGDYLGWLASDEKGRVVAGAGLWLMEWPAHPLDLTGTRGYILNVFTEYSYRLNGLARRLVLTILDWCREQEIQTVSLHASEDGRSLYEGLNFRPTNEMRLQFSSEHVEIHRVVVYGQR